VFSSNATNSMFRLIHDTLNKSMDPLDPIVIAARKSAKERDIDAEDSDGAVDPFAGHMKDVMHKKRVLLEEATNATKIQLMCFRTDDELPIRSANDVGEDGEDGDEAYLNAVHQSNGGSDDDDEGVRPEEDDEDE
jgi:hypothetical protein